MERTNSKIRFYNFGSEKIDFSKTNIQNSQKVIIASGNFHKALKKVTQKDINLLNDKLKKIILDINKFLLIHDVNVNENLDDDINKIDFLINKIDEIIKKLIIDKGNIRVGIFSINKKEKKRKIKYISECIEYLNKCQNDIILVKNEYNKLNKRNDLVNSEVIEKDEPKDIKNEDPLERTISFYMNRKNKK